MKKKKKKVQKATRKAMHEVVGVLIIALGIFSFISLYFSTFSGSLGPVYKQVLMGLFGVFSHLLPITMIVMGAMVIVAYHKTVNKTKLLLSLLMFFLLLCTIHLLYFNLFDKTNLLQFMKTSYFEGIEGNGSGFIPSLLVYAIYTLIGLPGALVFFPTCILINTLLLTNLSLKQLGNRLYIKLKMKEKKASIPKAKKEDQPHPTNKSFVGEIIAPLNDVSSTELVPLKDVFIKQNDALGQPSDIKIIDFEKDKQNINAIQETEVVKSNFNKEPNIDPVALEDDLTIKPLKYKQESIPYMIPPITLLKETTHKKSNSLHDKNVLSNAKLLEETLASFGVSAKVVQVSKGPVITRYELQPAPGVKVSKIKNLADDIALNLASAGVRIEAPIPGKAAIGVEVPNKDIAPVLLREVLESDSYITHSSKVAFALGKDIAGKNIIADISKMPHLLIAGATGSGKSVCINTLIVSILYKSTPDEVKLIMIDPKVVELSNYNGIPHLMIPVVTDPKKAAGALNWAVQEMVARYKLFADKGVRDMERYNEQLDEEGEKRLPQIVVIIDELADLMMVAPGDVEDAICRLAQMARAAGIHLVIATQRPSVDVITGVIKANIPSRIAFAVSSQIDSRTILDMGGAEKLLGRGDMLFYPVGASHPVRVQGAFLSEKEVEAVVTCIKNQNEKPQYNLEVLEEIAVENDVSINDEYDELLPEAIEIVIDAGQASISMIQRRLRVGYARAARLVDEMEKRGLVSGFDGSKPRNVLISKEEFLQQYKDQQ